MTEPDAREAQKSFEQWWLELVNREGPHWAEYLKLKRLCWDAYKAGMRNRIENQQAA